MVWPFEVPQAGDTAVQVGVGDALQLWEVSVQSVFFPVQVHVRGPFPFTVGSFPFAQRLFVGLVDVVVPLAVPQAEDSAVQVVGKSIL